MYTQKSKKVVKSVSTKSRWWYFQFYVYMILMLATAIFPYIRLDFVRSYDEKQKYKLTEDQKQQSEKKPHVKT